MMPDLITENVPKALLPLVVVIIGFLIIGFSLFMTRVLVKLIEKRKKKQKENGGEGKD
ncbi:MAG: hypothetical protein PHN99_05910 [Eubacteriales bacterium]|nr:hypothetical protein [Eubacteriales bacterium]MDD4717632.1 hypothetical protein [Eubacteriales bacterium]